MTELLPGWSLNPRARVRDFGTNDQVRHTNYFAQPEVVQFFKDTLN